MDAKMGPRYPVYLISDKYGAIGLDFRAASSPHGITLLIAGSFPNKMARTQCLKRVGRFSDKCTRVQDTTFPEYTMNRFDQKGLVIVALQKIRGDKSTAIKNGHYEERSPLEFKDGHMNNREFKNKEQNDILANKQMVKDEVKETK